MAVSQQPDSIFNWTASVKRQMQTVRQYDMDYERTRDQLEATLNQCTKCAPKDTMCLIDKSAKHCIVTVEMVRTWVLMLVSLPLFFIITYN